MHDKGTFEQSSEQREVRSHMGIWRAILGPGEKHARCVRGDPGGWIRGEVTG